MFPDPVLHVLAGPPRDALPQEHVQAQAVLVAGDDVDVLRARLAQIGGRPAHGRGL